MKTGLLWLTAYILTIWAANWAVQRFGVVPVGFGLTAPAGVYFVGLSLTCRDYAHKTLGRRAIFVAILIGALLSWAISDDFTIPGGYLSLALASGIAFFLSELVDMEVWTRLRARSEARAILLSNTVGAAVDSAVFLILAFGSLSFFWGQLWGKVSITLIFLALRLVLQRRRRAPSSHLSSGISA